MSRLCLILLCALMTDWIFLDGAFAVRPIADEVQAGAGYVAGLFLS
jgi:hypothetical protein